MCTTHIVCRGVWNEPSMLAWLSSTRFKSSFLDLLRSIRKRYKVLFWNGVVLLSLRI